MAITAFNVNLNTGVVTLTSDVSVSSFDNTSVYAVNSVSSNDTRLPLLGTVSGLPGTTITITLANNVFDKIRQTWTAGSPTWKASTNMFLYVPGVATNVQVTGSPTDTTNPTLVSWSSQIPPQTSPITSNNYPWNLALTFSKPLNTTSIDVTKLTLWGTAARGNPTYTLIDSTAVVANRTVYIKLSTDDWTAINSAGGLLLTSTNTFLSLIAAFATDTNALPNTATAAGTAVAGTPTVSANPQAYKLPSVVDLQIGAGQPTPPASGYVLSADGAGNLNFIAASAVNPGTVTAVTGTTANGFVVSVDNGTTTPAIKVATNVGTVATKALLLGDGTAISAAGNTDNISVGNVSTSALIARGSTSGNVQIQAPATAGSQTYTLPTATPTVTGQVLTSDTSGALSWTTPSSGPSNGLVYGAAAVATTANLAAFTGTPIIDGYQTLVSDVVLVKNQTNAQDDGLYSVSATGNWERLLSPVIVQGLVIIVSNGTTNGGDSFIQTAAIAAVGTTPQEWLIFSENGAASLQSVTNVGNSTTLSITSAGHTLSSGSPLTFQGATSGSVALSAPATAGTQSYILPTATPTTSGQVLASTTTGTMSWITPATTVAPGGSNGNLQFNSNGAFAGTSYANLNQTQATTFTYQSMQVNNSPSIGNTNRMFGTSGIAVPNVTGTEILWGTADSSFTSPYQRLIFSTDAGLTWTTYESVNTSFNTLRQSGTLEISQATVYIGGLFRLGNNLYMPTKATRFTYQSGLTGQYNARSIYSVSGGAWTSTASSRWGAGNFYYLMSSVTDGTRLADFGGQGGGDLFGNSYLYTSDFVTWTSVTWPAGLYAASTTGGISPLAAAYGNGTWVIVDYNNGGRAFTGGSAIYRTTNITDGNAWTRVTTTAGSGINWHSLTFFNGLFIALGFNTTTFMYSSDNGLTWTQGTIPAVARAQTYKWWPQLTDNGLMISPYTDNTPSGTSPTEVMHTTDGINWVSLLTTTTPGSSARYGAAGWSQGFITLGSMQTGQSARAAKSSNLVLSTPAIQFTGSPTAGQVLTASGTNGAVSWVTPAATGVTNVSIVAANGFSGTIATPTTTPAITLTTTLTADALVKSDGTGFVAAVAGTDYQKAITSSVAITAANVSGSSLTLRGDTSGSITFTAPLVAGTQSYTLPSATPTTNGQVLASTSAGVLSWSTPAASVVYFSGDSGATADIATNTQINAVLPASPTPKVGDLFLDTSSRTNNTQPVYLYINGNWRQVLTAFGGV